MMSDDSAELESDDIKLLHREKIINNIFLKYKDEYHEFFSLKMNPVFSDFNEQMFKNLCNKFSFDIEENLLALLNEYNLEQKKNINVYNKLLSVKRKLKCEKYNFYLFI